MAVLKFGRVRAARGGDDYQFMFSVYRNGSVNITFSKAFMKSFGLNPGEYVALVADDEAGRVGFEKSTAKDGIVVAIEKNFKKETYKSTFNKVPEKYAKFFASRNLPRKFRFCDYEVKDGVVQVQANKG